MEAEEYVKNGVISESSEILLTLGQNDHKDVYPLVVPKKWQGKLSEGKVLFDVLYPLSGNESRMLRSHHEKRQKTITDRQQEILLTYDTITLTNSLLASIACRGNWLIDYLVERADAFFRTEDETRRGYILNDLIQMLDKTLQKEHLTTAAQTYLEHIKKTDKAAFDEVNAFIDDVLKEVCSTKHLSEEVNKAVRAYRKKLEPTPKEKFYKEYQDTESNVWDGFAAMRNSKLSNPALLTQHKKMTKPNEKGVPIYFEPSNNAFLSVRECENINFNDNAKAEFAIVLMTFTKAIFQNADIVTIDKAREMCLYVDDFMEVRKFTNERKATDTLVTAIITLAFTRTDVEVVETIRDKEGNLQYITIIDKATGEKKTIPKTEVKHYNVPLLGSVELKRGNEKDPIGYTPKKFKDANGRSYFKVSLDMDLAKNLAYSPIMPYYVPLLKLDSQKYAHAMTLANKLSIYDNINRVHNNTKQIGIIGVPSLLECMNLKPYEDRQREETKKKPNGKTATYKRAYGNWRKEYMDTLDNNLDALQEIGFLKNWEWCNKNKKPLSKEQLDTYISTYDDFCALYVLHELNIPK